MMEFKTRQAYVALVLAMLLWGSSFIAFKFALESYSVMQIIFLRMLFSTLCFLFFWKALTSVKVNPKDWKWLLLMALCEPCLYFIFEGLALKYTSASQAGMITAILPLLVAFMAYWLLKEQIKKRQLTGFGFSLVGVVMLTYFSETNQHATHPLLGNGLQILAMIVAAGYTILARKMAAGYGALFLTAMQAIVGTVFFLPLALLEPFPTEWNAQAFSAIIYLGPAVSVVAVGCYNYSLKFLPAAQSVAFINLIPVFTLFFAFLLLGESLTQLQWLAVLLVFIGVVISQLKFKKDKALPSESALQS